jgi:hypothetical protein
MSVQVHPDHVNHLTAGYVALLGAALLAIGAMNHVANKRRSS